MRPVVIALMCCAVVTASPLTQRTCREHLQAHLIMICSATDIEQIHFLSQFQVPKIELLPSPNESQDHFYKSVSHCCVEDCTLTELLSLCAYIDFNKMFQQKNVNDDTSNPTVTT